MRKSAFDGSFYPSSKDTINKFIKSALSKAKLGADVSNACAYVAPHAGYIYSGKTAAYIYKAMQSNKNIEGIGTIIIIGPNHTGIGEPISVSMEDWETPVGISLNDKELSREIIKNSQHIHEDESAHRGEHSIEVQLPFIKYLFPKKRIVFICMGDQSVESSELLSNAIIKASEKLRRKALVLASSDLNHYESAETSKRKDEKLLEAIKELDYEKFNGLVYQVEDSICGYGPVSVAMIFARHMHATNGIILKYANSGDQTGDYSSVVAYSAIAFQ